MRKKCDFGICFFHLKREREADIIVNRNGQSPGHIIAATAAYLLPTCQEKFTMAHFLPLKR